MYPASVSPKCLHTWSHGSSKPAAEAARGSASSESLRRARQRSSIPKAFPNWSSIQDWIFL
jgi:hypothetical protein